MDRAPREPRTVFLSLDENTEDHQERCCLPHSATDDSQIDLDSFATDVTTIAQFRCERATDYADIETLICQLPIDRCTLAAHDALAPYSGPYPMAILVRAFIIEEINDWDDTALHDYLRANPSLRRRLGFKTLPVQSTF